MGSPTEALRHPAVIAVLRSISRLLHRLHLAGLVDAGERLLRRTAGDQVEVTTQDGLVLQGGMDQYFILDDVADGRYEPMTMSLFRAAIHPGATVLDLGANVGIFAIPAARAVGPDGRVIAFEPNPRTLPHLRANIERNGLSNVTVVEAGAAAEAGTHTFVAATRGNTSTIYGDIIRDEPVEAVFTVPMTTVDSVVAGARVDVVKIDVEGSESAALDGMAETLERNPDLVLFIEFEPTALRGAGTDPDAMLARLRARFASVDVVDEHGMALADPDTWVRHETQNLYCHR